MRTTCIIVIMMDGMGCILAWLQGRRCVPGHLTHCPMLDGCMKEGGQVPIKGMED